MVVIDESWTRGNNENEHVFAITLATARLWPLGQADSTGLDEIVGALSKLSTDELCALKEAVDRKLSKKVDFLTLLPEDLCIAVLKWLGPEDFWSCLQVSRRWRDLLLDADCMRIICRDLHPGLLEMAVAQGAKGAKEATCPTILDAQRRSFKEATLYSLFWSKGGAATIFFQKPWLSNNTDGPNQRMCLFLGGNGKLGSCPREEWWLPEGPDGNRCYFGDSLYSSGRLVCQPYWDPSSSTGPLEWFLVVDDFAARTRRILRVPQIYGDLSQRVRLLCVGDSLAVARDLTHRRLAIWSLSEDDAFSLARLPRRIDQAVTAGDVVIGTYRVGDEDDQDNRNENDGLNGMTMWRWTRDNGGRVAEWALAEPANFAAELMGLRLNCLRHAHSILIHPGDKSIVYLFVASLLPARPTIDEPDPEPVTMAVFEVTDKQISGRWKIKLHASWLDEQSDPGNFGFKPVDRHGSYSTATRQQDGPKRGTVCHEKVVFNIYTKKLTLIASVVPLHSSTMYGKTLLWEGKYITWQEPSNRRYFDRVLPLVVTAAFASEKLPRLPPRPLNYVPYRRFPVRHGCEVCNTPATPGEGASEVQEAGVDHEDKSVGTKPCADLEKHTSLHQVLIDMTPRLVLPENSAIHPCNYLELCTTSRYLTETYHSMEACHLDSAMFCGEGQDSFDEFPMPLGGLGRYPIAIRRALNQGHQQPSPEILTRFPLMWTDGRYMVLLSWLGYMVWEFRRPRMESS
ncbi:hypothetical protein MCOR07_008115 [Pyricularia oryzae]|nr:hypothetical protein MCOR07_008115 [Pyricularia oryzae]